MLVGPRRSKALRAPRHAGPAHLTTLRLLRSFHRTRAVPRSRPVRTTRGPGGSRPGVVSVGTVARVRARTRSRPTRQAKASGSIVQGPSGVNAPRWRHGARRIDHRRGGIVVPIGQRAPGRLDHFQRAGDAGTVPRHQPARGLRVALGELGIERRHPFPLEPGANRGPHVRRDRRHGRETLGQGLEVEPGAADDDGWTPFPRGLGQHLICFPAPSPGRVVLRGIDMAVQPMRRPRFVRGRRSRGQDPQVAIDLHGIRIDDDAAQLFGQRQRQCRLAAGGRTGQKDSARLHPATGPRRLTAPCPPSSFACRSLMGRQ